MKRILALLLAVIMVLSMAACGKEKPDTDTPATPDEVTKPATADEPAEFVPFVPEVGEGVYSKTTYTVTNQEVKDLFHSLLRLYQHILQRIHHQEHIL